MNIYIIDGNNSQNMCNLCKEFYKKYPLIEDDEHRMAHQLEENLFQGPTECAFKLERFNEDNFCCKTISRLRDLAEEFGFKERDDMSAGSLGVLAIPEDAVTEEGQYGYIVMAWYKDRGKTSNAYVINEGKDVQTLNIYTAEAVIKYYDKRIKCKN